MAKTNDLVDPSSKIRVICFLNPKSGGQKGALVMDAMVKHLGEDQVYDLERVKTGKWKPEDALREEISRFKKLRILVCGGDGTVGWILSCLDRIGVQSDQDVSIAIMPLGTGNDLSRAFNWGNGFSKAMLRASTIEKVNTSTPAILDRWLVCVMPYNELTNPESELVLPHILSIRRFQTRIISEVDSTHVQNISHGVIRVGGSFSNRTEQNASTMMMEHQKQTLNEEGEINDAKVDTTMAPMEISEQKTFDVDDNASHHSVDSLSHSHPAPSISVTNSRQFWWSFDGVFNNYFSIGIDAKSALAFHEARNKNPEKFKSQFINQIRYLQYGTPAAGFCPCCCAPPPLLRSSTKLQIKKKDSKQFTDVEIPSNIRGIIILNIGSYAGGRNLWGTKRPISSRGFMAPSCDDGLLEIVGFSNIFSMGLTLGLNKVGFHAVRIAQGSEIRLKIRTPTWMQIDGEPWAQPPSTVHIRHHAKSKILQVEESSCCSFL